MILVSHRLTLQRLKQVQRVLPLGLSRELREIKISHNFHEVFTLACSRQRQRAWDFITFFMETYLKEIGNHQIMEFGFNSIFYLLYKLMRNIQ